MDEQAKRLADYEETMRMFHLLSDIRFKLLALVPTLAGIGVALLQGQAAQVQLGVGLLGFFSTLGIVFYDQRNTQFYNNAVGRARELEHLLALDAFDEGHTTGGVLSERADKPRRLFVFRNVPESRSREGGSGKLARFSRIPNVVRGGGVDMVHDRGLALVYSSALAAWVFLVVDATVAIGVTIWDQGISEVPSAPGGRGLWWVAVAFAAVIWWYLLCQFEVLDRRQTRPGYPDGPGGSQQE